MQNFKNLIYALKCQDNMTEHRCLKEDCIYFIPPGEELLKQWQYDPHILEMVKEGKCDNNRMMKDSLDALEQMNNIEDDLR